MKKAKKILASFEITAGLLFLLCEAVNLIFQGTIYNHYADKALMCDFENDFWNIAVQYKNIGVFFSEISVVLFCVFITSAGLHILSLCTCKFKSGGAKL